MLNASRSQELARKKSSGTQSNIFYELEGEPSRVSMNRSVCLNLNTVEPLVSDHMQFLSYNICSSMFLALSGRLQEFKNNGKLLNHQPEMWSRSLMKEVVVYDSFHLQGFHKGNFGILVRWSLREGGHVDGLVAPVRL